MASEWFHGRPIQQFEYSFRRAFATHRSPAAYIGAKNVIKVIIGANVLVFGAWIYGEQTRNYGLLRQLTDKFTLSLRNLKEHRYYTLLTSAFSHRALVHIGFNMFSLWTFGQIMAFAGIGAVNTAAVCLVSAVAGSAAWAYHHAFIKPDPRQSHIFNRQVIRARDMDTALGASGLVMGAGAAAACLWPFAPVQLMLIPINIPLWGAVAGFFMVDAYFVNSSASMIGHAAHMGGAVAGVAYYLLALRNYGGVWRLISRRLR